jgi:hypothetical protein
MSHVDQASATSQQAAHNPNNRADASERDLVTELKRLAHENRLPADLKEQILADEPPPEVLEHLYRNLQENGGLSSEEFIASLGLEAEPRP